MRCWVTQKTKWYYLLQKKSALIYSRKIFNSKCHCQGSWYLGAKHLSALENKIKQTHFSSFLHNYNLLSWNVLKRNFHTLVSHGITFFCQKCLLYLCPVWWEEIFLKRKKKWLTKWVCMEASLESSGRMPAGAWAFWAWGGRPVPPTSPQYARGRDFSVFGCSVLPMVSLTLSEKCVKEAVRENLVGILDAVTWVGGS